MTASTARTIRVPTQLWSTAIRRARDEGTTISDLIRSWLEDYVDEDKTVTHELAAIMARLKAVRTRLVPDGGDDVGNLIGEME